MKLCLSIVVLILVCSLSAEGLTRLEYNNPGLVVDLGVGLWATPLPMDYTGNGQLDLIVASTGKAYNGVYLFENPAGGGGKMPVFMPAKRLGDARKNIRVSYVDGEPKVLAENFEMVDFKKNCTSQISKIYPKNKIHKADGRTRANQWHYVDYNGNGVQDLVVGVGDWSDYGWDNAYDRYGRWLNGPLRGFVYVILNKGTNNGPDYDEPKKMALLTLCG